jgi:glycerol-3-phosphate dehydrogenase (NAD(P)+)
MRVVVLGAGAWGCALGSLLSDGGHDVALWEVDPEAAESLGRTRIQRYLGTSLPASIDVTADIARALRDRALIALATPS